MHKEKNKKKIRFFFSLTFLLSTFSYIFFCIYFPFLSSLSFSLSLHSFPLCLYFLPFLSQKKKKRHYTFLSLYLFLSFSNNTIVFSCRNICEYNNDISVVNIVELPLAQLIFFIKWSHYYPWKMTFQDMGQGFKSDWILISLFILILCYLL